MTAFILRIGLGANIDVGFVPSDGINYHNIAVNLASGNGYSNNISAPYEPYFFREPLSENMILNYNEAGLDMHGSILMDFGNNQTAQLSFGMDNSYKNSYSIWGTRGEITLMRAFSIPENHIPICRVANQGLVREYQLKPCNHFVEELKMFSYELGSIANMQEVVLL
jgi:hypothetical protein